MDLRTQQVDQSRSRSSTLVHVHRRNSTLVQTFRPPPVPGVASQIGGSPAASKSASSPNRAGGMIIQGEKAAHPPKLPAFPNVPTPFVGLPQHNVKCLFGKYGGLHALLNAMFVHSANPRVVLQAAAALAVLGDVAEHQSMMREGKGLPIVFAVLENFRHSLECARQLSKLCALLFRNRANCAVGRRGEMPQLMMSIISELGRGPESRLIVGQERKGRAAPSFWK